ncbi:MAG: hypothetical protein HY330_02415, partial [Chloroflexi bacterium]|nr:hypothetical protein [Chloroflexota bacterium]
MALTPGQGASSVPLDSIIVRGAREHNLKNIEVVIPRDKLVVITGISGCGKSSLAFDTIYAEGQRRYVESLSAYARQFLGLMEKPDVDYIEGLSPAISIDQKGVSRNPRSTVGTVTEIYDYLRLLFARTGHPHCSSCGREVAAQTVQQIVDSLLKLPPGTRFMVLAPMTRHKKGEHLGIFDELRKKGFVRVRVNGQVRDLSEEIRLDKQKWHDIDAVVDRLEASADPAEGRGRLSDSVETALKLGDGVVVASLVDSLAPASARGEPEAASVRGEPGAATVRGEPGAASARGEPEAASARGSTGSPRAGAAPGSPRAEAGARLSTM